MVDADEAMKRAEDAASQALDAYLGEAAWSISPGAVSIVRAALLASLEASGWPCIKLTSELTLSVTECPSGAANCRVAKAIAAAPRLGAKR